MCIGDLSIETPNKYLLDNFNLERLATKRILFGTYFDVVYHSGTWTENKEIYIASTKDVRATQVRCLTAATAAVTLAFLFVEMLCYVLGRLHSSCVLCTKIGLLR